MQTEIVCGGIVAGYAPSGSAVEPALATPTTTIPAADVYSVGEVVIGPNGQACVTFTQLQAPDAADVLAPAAEIAAIELMALYGVCPGTPVPPAITANPAAYATAFWQTIPLPVPKPTIPPGYAITGMPAYLVTGGTVDPPGYSEATPLGQLTVTAHGAYHVDWGDGATGGPYDAEGQPYPHGTIAHTYEDVGTVTVTVTESWAATWTLGAARGTLAGIQTRAAIDRFQIQQIQAVITQNS